MNTILRRIVWLIMLVPAVYLTLIWKQIPEKVPLHFDLQGNVNKYGTRHEFLILMIGLIIINAILYLVISNIHKIDPKRNASINKGRMQRMAFGVAVYMSAIWIMLIYQILHKDVTITIKFVFIAIGLLFALIGNNMYNIQPNYFAGIRLPWTLENEDNWRRTHHLAGRLWFFGGLIFAAIVLFINNNSISYIGGALLAVAILIPVFYSYIIYKEQKKIKV